MNESRRFRFGLKARILGIVLGLPFLCICIFSVILYVSMLNLRSMVGEGMKSVGHEVAERSKDELREQSEEHLLRLASDEAAFVDHLLARVMEEVSGLCSRARDVWDGKAPESAMIESPGYALAPGLDREEVQQEIQLSEQLVWMFPAVFFQDNNLAFLYVATRGGVFRIYPWNENMELAYEARNEPWYRGAFTSGGAHWSRVFVYSGEEDLMLTCSRSFSDSTGAPCGVIGADVSLKSVTDEISNTRSGDRGYLVLIDRRGNVIARPDMDPEDERWDESCSLENLFLSNDERLRSIAREMANGGKGIQVCGTAPDEKYVAFAPIPTTTWSLGVVMPIREIVFPIERSVERIDGITRRSLERIDHLIDEEQIRFGLLFFTMVIIIVFFGLRLANKVTQPVLTLARGARKVGGGDLAYRLDVKTGDEIEELAESFNRMAADLEAYLERTNRDTAKRERLEQAQLMANGVQEMFGGESSYDWLLPHMEEETFRAGDTLFRKGDRSDKLYYIQEGSVMLVEIGKRVIPGNVIGEMGVFRPSRERSLSAVCETDLRLSSITHERLFDLYSRDATVGFHLIQMITQRYVDSLREETRERERMESELRIARDIQTSTLPSVFPAFPDRPEFDVYATMEPAKDVGGDLYDFFLIDPERFCFLIGDVAGKGVPAALFMMTAKMLLKAALQRRSSLGEVLREVNRIIASENTSSMFITLFCAVLDTRTGEVEYGNAGHNPPLHAPGGEPFIFMKPRPNFVLGGMEDISFVCERIALKPGDVLFLYTDGVTEAMNGQGKLYSEARLQQTLSGLGAKPLQELIEGVRRDVRLFAAGEAPSDDLTMLVVRFNGRRALP
ncbi:MAG: SpoIIE family protein phosphatase [Deltaproteobacteria bacterium]|nr:SpoIIE family protein phosphatase [Deltaproteobacteria bacterium]